MLILLLLLYYYIDGRKTCATCDCDVYNLSLQESHLEVEILKKIS